MLSLFGTNETNRINVTAAYLVAQSKSSYQDVGVIRRGDSEVGFLT